MVQRAKLKCSLERPLWNQCSLGHFHHSVKGKLCWSDTFLHGISFSISLSIGPCHIYFWDRCWVPPLYFSVWSSYILIDTSCICIHVGVLVCLNVSSHISYWWWEPLWFKPISLVFSRYSCPYFALCHKTTPVLVIVFHSLQLNSHLSLFACLLLFFSLTGWSIVTAFIDQSTSHLC